MSFVLEMTGDAECVVWTKRGPIPCRRPMMLMLIFFPMSIFALIHYPLMIVLSIPLVYFLLACELCYNSCRQKL